MAEHDRASRSDAAWEDLKPEEVAPDTNPSNTGPGRTAYDVKQLHDKWPGFSDRVLKQIPVLDTGTQLREGGVYLDLLRAEDGPFQGMNDREVEPETYIVAKDDVDYELWNALCGETDNYRLGRFAPDVQPEPTNF